MKKNPFVCFLLAFLMIFQLLPAQVLATEVDDTPASEETVAESAPITEPTLPQFTGNASVNAGCSSINAVYPLMNSSQLSLKLGAALMYEMNSGTLLYTMNPDAKMYPASVTKVMTCLLALEHGDFEQMVEVSEEVVANRDPDGSH